VLRVLRSGAFFWFLFLSLFFGFLLYGAQRENWFSEQDWDWEWVNETVQCVCVGMGTGRGMSWIM